jgi:hypothetical protein
MTTLCIPLSSGRANSVSPNFVGANCQSRSMSSNPSRWWMVNLNGGWSTRFSDHFKPVEITEYSQTWVKASRGGFESRMQRVSAFSPLAKKKILESLAADKTSLSRWPKS